MNECEQKFSVTQNSLEALAATICAGGVVALRIQTGDGVDLNATDQFGESILTKVMDQLEFHPQTSRYDVVRELLRLGADPNAVKTESEIESLYDWGGIQLPLQGVEHQCAGGCRPARQAGRRCLATAS